MKLLCNHPELWSDPAKLASFARANGLILFKKGAKALIQKTLNDDKAWKALLAYKYPRFVESTLESMTPTLAQSTAFVPVRQSVQHPFPNPLRVIIPPPCVLPGSGTVCMTPSEKSPAKVDIYVELYMCT